MFCDSQSRRSSWDLVCMMVGRMSFFDRASTMYVALVWGKRYPCALSFFSRDFFVSVQKHVWSVPWMWMVRSELKFAVRMQKHSSMKSSLVECVLTSLNSWMRCCIFFCMLLCLSFMMVEGRSFICPLLWKWCVEKNKVEM